MLRYFRINDPYRLIGLLVIMTLLYLPLFIDPPATTFPELKSFVIGEKVSDGYMLYSQLIDRTPPLAAWFYGVCNVFGRSLTIRHILAFLILFSQGAFLGIALIDKKAFTENTYLPTLFFVFLVFISFDTISLSADLVAFGFILLTLNNLFKEIEFRIQRDETILNIGVFVGLASLLSFSYIIYLPGAVIILLLFTRNTFRKYLLLSFGFLLPHLLLLTGYFFTDNLGALWQFYYLPNLQFSTVALITTKSLFVLCAVPLFYLFISLFILGRDARLSKYQSQIFQTMFLWFIVAIVQLFLAQDLRPQSLIPLFPSVSFFLAHFILLIRRKRFAEFNIWVLIVGIVAVAYLGRYNKINNIRYDKLVVKEPDTVVTNKRILVLDNQPSLFLHNRLAAPFYEWSLCKSIFEQPDYYENLLIVHRSFEKEMPEVIVDPKNLMEGFFNRLPTLKSQYEKSPEGYRLKKVSN